MLINVSARGILLRIQSTEMLRPHPLVGHVFETFVFTEWLTHFYHSNQESLPYFWRDKAGKEIDFLIDRGQFALAVEVKLG